MLWFSAINLGLLTFHAWQTARHMKADGDASGLRAAYLAAAIVGAIGTLAFVIAAAL